MFPPGADARIRESPTPELEREVRPGTDANIVETLTPQLGVGASEVLAKLSFSHIAELLQRGDKTQRAFYEVESIRGNWSVRELKRTNCWTSCRNF